MQQKSEINQRKQIQRIMNKVKIDSQKRKQKRLIIQENQNNNEGNLQLNSSINRINLQYQSNRSIQSSKKLINNIISTETLYTTLEGEQKQEKKSHKIRDIIMNKNTTNNPNSYEQHLKKKNLSKKTQKQQDQNQSQQQQITNPTKQLISKYHITQSSNNPLTTNLLTCINKQSSYLQKNQQEIKKRLKCYSQIQKYHFIKKYQIPSNICEQVKNKVQQNSNSDQLFQKNYDKFKNRNQQNLSCCWLYYNEFQPPNEEYFIIYDGDFYYSNLQVNSSQYRFRPTVQEINLVADVGCCGYKKTNNCCVNCCINCCLSSYCNFCWFWYWIFNTLLNVVFIPQFIIFDVTLYATSLLDQLDQGNIAICVIGLIGIIMFYIIKFYDHVIQWKKAKPKVQQYIKQTQPEPDIQNRKIFGLKFMRLQNTFIGSFILKLSGFHQLQYRYQQQQQSKKSYFYQLSIYCLIVLPQVVFTVYQGIKDSKNIQLDPQLKNDISTKIINILPTVLLMILQTLKQLNENWYNSQSRSKYKREGGYILADKFLKHGQIIKEKESVGQSNIYSIYRISLINFPYLTWLVLVIPKLFYMIISLILNFSYQLLVFIFPCECWPNNILVKLNQLWDDIDYFSRLSNHCCRIPVRIIVLICKLIGYCLYFLYFLYFVPLIIACVMASV